MDQETLISVVIPAYNKGTIIQRSLKFVLKQTCQDFVYEVIVVDNNSTDNTLEILTQLSTEYPHLRYYVEKDKGAGAARNRGVLESNGELLVFLDDDIIVQSDHILQHYLYHKRNSLGSDLCVVALARDATVCEPAILKLYQPVHVGISASEDIRYNVGIYLTSQSFSIMRDTLNEISFAQNGKTQFFDEKFYRRQDSELGYRLSKNGVGFIYTDSIYCEHHHVFRWKDITRRAYLSGYYLQVMHHKHPDSKENAPSLIIHNPVLNTMLLFAGYISYIMGFLIRWLSPRIILKGIKAILLYHASRGYQQAGKNCDCDK